MMRVVCFVAILSQLPAQCDTWLEHIALRAPNRLVTHCLKHFTLSERVHEDAASAWNTMRTSTWHKLLSSSRQEKGLLRLCRQIYSLRASCSDTG